MDNTSNSGATVLKELKEFLTFLQSLWGILAGISVFFPLSNVLIKFLPMKSMSEDGVFVHLSPPLITAIATIFTLFVVLWTFGKRHQLNVKKRLKRLARQAWLSFGVGALSLIIYLVIYFLTYYLAWDSWGWSSDDPRRLIIEIPLLVTYSIFFALITRAFMLLGMSEFFPAKTMKD
jgi:hypothetical protein